MIDQATKEIHGDREKRMLDLIAQVYRRMQDRSVELRRMPMVSKVVVQFQPIQYSDGAMIEGYVDAFLKDGASVCWFLDVYWKHGQWTIEKSLEERSDGDVVAWQDLGSVAEEDFERFAAILDDEMKDLLQILPSSIGKGT